jgi:hypothetical protein
MANTFEIEEEEKEQSDSSGLHSDEDMKSYNEDSLILGKV